MWIQLAILVISYIVSAAVASRSSSSATRAAFDDFDFPQADEGTAQTVIFGDVWTESWMVLGVGNYRTTAIRK